MKKIAIFTVALAALLGTTVFAATGTTVKDTPVTVTAEQTVAAPAKTTDTATTMMKGENVVDQTIAPRVATLEKINIGYGETILGPAEATQDQMVRYIKKHNPDPRINCSLEDLVQYYYDEAGEEGIRADIALCQALKETHFFLYDGDVVPEQNNYCGLGTPGNGERGCYFPTPQIGVRAHIQHLLGYATTRLPKNPLVDPRYEVLKQKYPRYYGHIPYWTGLNGKWAVPGDGYGEEILYFWAHAKNM